MKRFVYLIQMGDLFKIGVSEDPYHRLRRLKLGGKAEVVHTFESKAPFAVENALHRRFSECNCPEMGREWFRLPARSVAAIKRLDFVERASDLPKSLTPPGRVHFGVKIPATLKRRLAALAEASGRKIKHEFIRAMELYCGHHEYAARVKSAAK